MSKISKVYIDSLGLVYKQGFLDGYNHAVDISAYEIEEVLPSNIEDVLDDAINQLKKD